MSLLHVPDNAGTSVSYFFLFELFMNDLVTCTRQRGYICILFFFLFELFMNEPATCTRERGYICILFFFI